MNIVILAAGMGKRMHSARPKVLHSLAGKALLQHVIDTAQQLVAQDGMPHKLVVVYGHGATQVPDALHGQNVALALQAQQLGTGHAVQQAVPQLDPALATLVLYGDVPLTRVASLQRLIDVTGSDKLGILTMNVQDATGLGRIVRGKRPDCPHRRTQGCQRRRVGFERN